MKKKQIIILSALIFILIIVIVLNFTVNFFKSPTKEESIKYTTEAKTVMKEKDVYDIISKKDYNQTVETMLIKNEFKKEYLDTYYEINYQDREDFGSLINLFLDKNYSSEEINNIFEYLSDKNINKLKEMDYVSLEDYVKISNLEVDKINRYKDFEDYNNTTKQDAVTKVNIGLDQAFYSEIETIEIVDSYVILLNKYNALPDDYEPNDLVSLSINPNMKLRKEAAEAYEKLQSAALLDNVKIIPFSAYRSKQYQTNLYNNYVARDGLEAADTYSARARHSEHELGLAIDVRSHTLTANLTDSDYEWMLNNSYKYGYIVRYPKGSTSITGYIEEPWHLRYLGVEIATDVVNKNITFDEYYDLYLKNKEA